MSARATSPLKRLPYPLTRILLIFPISFSAAVSQRPASRRRRAEQHSPFNPIPNHQWPLAQRQARCEGVLLGRLGGAVRGDIVACSTPADANAFFYRRRAPTAQPLHVPEPATRRAGTSHPSCWDLRPWPAAHGDCPVTGNEDGDFFAGTRLFLLERAPKFASTVFCFCWIQSSFLLPPSFVCWNRGSSFTNLLPSCSVFTGSSQFFFASLFAGTGLIFASTVSCFCWIEPIFLLQPVLHFATLHKPASGNFCYNRCQAMLQPAPRIAAVQAATGIVAQRRR